MEIPTTVGALIGLVGAPILIVMVVQHLLLAVQGEDRRDTLGLEVRVRDYSLVLRDGVGIATALLLRDSGGLVEVYAAGVPDTIATAILVGLALSYLAGQVYDRFPALTGARK